MPRSNKELIQELREEFDEFLLATEEEVKGLKDTIAELETSIGVIDSEVEFLKEDLL